MNNVTGKLISVEEYEKLIPKERQGYTLASYATATQIENMKVGRNEICPCGSGKKFKKCHQESPSLNQESHE